MEIFNSLTVLFKAGNIGYTIMTGAFATVLGAVILHVIYLPYPEGKEYDLWKKKQNLYEILYFHYCVDLKQDRYIDNKEGYIFLKESLIRFFHDEYLQNPSYSKFLSTDLQQCLRNFIKEPSDKYFKYFRDQLAKEYRQICRRLKISMYRPPNMKFLGIPYSEQFYLCSTISLILIIISMYYASRNIKISLLFLVLSTPFYYFVYHIYVVHIKP